MPADPTIVSVASFILRLRLCIVLEDTSEMMWHGLYRNLIRVTILLIIKLAMTLARRPCVES